MWLVNSGACDPGGLQNFDACGDLELLPAASSSFSGGRTRDAELRGGERKAGDAKKSRRSIMPLLVTKIRRA